MEGGMDERSHSDATFLSFIATQNHGKALHVCCWLVIFFRLQSPERSELLGIEAFLTPRGQQTSKESIPAIPIFPAKIAIVNDSRRNSQSGSIFTPPIEMV